MTHPLGTNVSAVIPVGIDTPAASPPGGGDTRTSTWMRSPSAGPAPRM
ncbi:hypothetical protein [Streptomyces sp. NPDC050535]